MDPKRFDALVQSLATPGSRRRLLGGLVAGSLAPLTTAAKTKRQHGAATDAAGATGRLAASAGAGSGGPQPAACLPVGKRCSQPAGAAGRGKGKRGKGKHHPPACSKCCSRFGAAGPDGKPRCTCKSEGIACDGDSQCCSGQCRSNACTGCPPNSVFCPDGCVDLQTDAQHCGSCTNACASGQRCVGGTCVCDGTSCPRGCCQNGSCQRGTSDQACGINGAACQTCQTCTTCDGTQCAAQSGVCCGDASVCQGGTCVACGANQRCQGGQCVCDATSCPNGCCNGNTCVVFDQQTDQQCGTNGAACAACAACTTCRGGVCQNKPDGTDCGGAGSGARCCGGTCRPPKTCLPPGTCCEQGATCMQCCGTVGRGSGCSETGGYVCGVSLPGGSCIGDSGCFQDLGTAICVCGTCCVAAGGAGYCSDPNGCCSGACNGDVCA